MIILAHIRHQFALSREIRLKARQKTRYKRTTDSNHGEPVAPKLLDQGFTCDGADQKWDVDISYLWTTEGWPYLAIVVDLCSRRIIGWEAKKLTKCFHP